MNYETRAIDAIHLAIPGNGDATRSCKLMNNELRASATCGGAHVKHLVLIADMFLPRGT